MSLPSPRASVSVSVGICSHSMSTAKYSNSILELGLYLNSECFIVSTYCILSLYNWIVSIAIKHVQICPIYIQ
jgi:hypothetical protein